jgi:hypothetical protein
MKRNVDGLAAGWFDLYGRFEDFGRSSDGLDRDEADDGGEIEDGEESLEKGDDDSDRVDMLISRWWCWLRFLVKMAGLTASKSKATTCLRW